jgi:hypothetical protein
MKRLLLAALLSTAFSAQAQRPLRPQPAPPLTMPIVYCELERRETHALQPLALDYGQHEPTYVQDADLAQAAAFVAKLPSIAAALNYLHSRGWEFVSATTVPYDVDKSGTIASRVRYLLRRRTPRLP